MNVVWGIRWDREDDRRQRLLMAAALVAALAAVALLLISRGPAHGRHARGDRARRARQARGRAARRGAQRRHGRPVAAGRQRLRRAGARRLRARPRRDGRSGRGGRRRSHERLGRQGLERTAAATPGTSLDDVREAIGATQSGATGAGVDVAVIDTGMVPVPALAAAGKVVQGPDFSNQSRDTHLAHLDTFGHGTHVAGIIAGDDEASGFRGVAPGARLVNVKAAGADGSTTLGAIVASVGWVIAHRNDNGLHVRVLNLSFGTPPSRYQSDLLAYAVEQAWKAGIVVVVSAGNEGEKRRGLTSPGYDPFVLTVGADDLAGTAAVGDDVVPDWSSRGAGRNPDLVAPGRSIVSLRDPNSALDLAHPEARVGDDRLQGQRHVAGRRRRLRRRRAAARAPARPLARPGQGDHQVHGRPAVRTRARRPGCGPAERHPLARRAEPRPRRGAPAVRAGPDPRRRRQAGRRPVEWPPRRRRARRPRRRRVGRRQVGRLPRGAAPRGAAPRGAARRGAAPPGAAPRGAAPPGAARPGAAAPGAARPGRADDG